MNRILDSLFQRDTMTGKRIVLYPVMVLAVFGGFGFLLFKLATWEMCG